MKDQRIIELVNGRLDGVITPTEDAELDALLSSDADTQTLLSEMKTLHNVLASVPEVEPPASIKVGIMDSIARLESAARPATTESLLDRILAPFTRRPGLAMSYAFALGLIVGLGVLSIIQTGPDARTVQGTIANFDATVIAETDLAVGESTANVIISELGDELRIDVSLIASDDVNLILIPQGQDAIEIHSKTGTQTYSILLPVTPSIVASISDGDASDEINMTVGQPNR